MRVGKLGHLGEGVLEGPVYAPMTLPDEEVSGTVAGNRLTDIRIITPSPHRIKPPCRYFRSCGGCAMQHADDDFVAGWKRKIVRQALGAHGLPMPQADVLTSPPRSRRRVSFAGRRGKSAPQIGFHARGQDVLVAVDQCLLLEDRINAAMPFYRALVMAGASRKSTIRIAVTDAENGLDVQVADGKPLDAAGLSTLAAMAAEAEVIRLIWNDEVAFQSEAPVVTVGDIAVRPPAGSFLQATRPAQRALTEIVSDIVGPARRLADLFAGIGTFALPLARERAVHAVEGDADMVAALLDGWRQAQGLRPVTGEVRDLFRNPLLASELAQYDALVIDPPRAGAAAQVAEIARADAERVAYVSCNPVSFARDAGTLISGGYHLDRLHVVDQFRWSPHVELVAGFSRG